MNTYSAVKNRLLQFLGEKKMSIHKLAMESAVALVVTALFLVYFFVPVTL